MHHSLMKHDTPARLVGTSIRQLFILALDGTLGMPPTLLTQFNSPHADSPREPKASISSSANERRQVPTAPEVYARRP
jgi:hypothetical protein